MATPVGQTDMKLWFLAHFDINAKEPMYSWIGRRVLSLSSALASVDSHSILFVKDAKWAEVPMDQFYL